MLVWLTEILRIAPVQMARVEDGFQVLPMVLIAHKVWLGGGVDHLLVEQMVNLFKITMIAIQLVVYGVFVFAAMTEMMHEAKRSL